MFRKVIYSILAIAIALGGIAYVAGGAMAASTSDTKTAAGTKFGGAGFYSPNANFAGRVIVLKFPAREIGGRNDVQLLGTVLELAPAPRSSAMNFNTNASSAGNTNSSSSNTNASSSNTNASSSNTNSSSGNTNSSSGNTNSSSGNTNSSSGNTNSSRSAGMPAFVYFDLKGNQMQAFRDHTLAIFYFNPLTRVWTRLPTLFQATYGGGASFTTNGNGNGNFNANIASSRSGFNGYRATASVRGFGFYALGRIKSGSLSTSNMTPFSFMVR